MLEQDSGHPYMKRDQVWNQSNDKQSGTWHRPWWHISTVTLQVGIPGWFLWPSLWTQPRVRVWRVWKKNMQKSVVFACSDPCFVRIFQTTLRRASICCTMFYYGSKNCWVLCSKKQLQIFEHFPVDFSILGRWNSQSTKSTNRSSSETKGYPGYMFDIGVSHIKWFKKC